MIDITYKSDVHGILYNVKTAILIGSVFFIILGIIMSLLLSRSISRPIVELSKGAYDQASDTERGSLEIGQLSSLIGANNEYLNNLNISARAGEAGRGFAVVADEIRKLHV